MKFYDFEEESAAQKEAIYKALNTIKKSYPHLVAGFGCRKVAGEWDDFAGAVIYDSGEFRNNVVGYENLLLNFDIMHYWRGSIEEALYVYDSMDKLNVGKKIDLLFVKGFEPKDHASKLITRTLQL